MSPLLLLCGLSATPAHAGDFMDVWISTAFEDTNVLAGPEAESPSANFVERGNAAFFENYESRTTDDISRAQLVLYKRSDSFFSGWWTEAAFVLRYTPYLDPDLTDPGTNIEDDGSYVRLVRDLPGDDHTLSLTGYAVDSDRFRLGYSYDLSWGGRELFVDQVGAAPGVRLQWERQGSYAFVGAKTAIMNAVPTEDDGSQTTATKLNQTFYAALAGGGVMVGDLLKLEANAGSFQQGQFTSADATGPLYGTPIVAMGVAGQVAFRSRPEVKFIQSGDLRLYRNEPDSVQESYIRHAKIDGVGLLAQTEVDRLSHNLMVAADSDATEIETGYAGDLQSVVIAGTTAFEVDLVYKDLRYIVFDVPGLVSQQAMGDGYETTPQLYGRFAIEHWFEKAHVTPGFGIGLMQPATYTTQDGKTVVQIDDRNSEQIPDGQAPTAILSGVAGVNVDLSESMVAVGELLYTLNNNLSNTTEGSSERVLAPANQRNQLGFNVILRARF